MRGGVFLNYICDRKLKWGAKDKFSKKIQNDHHIKPR